MRINREISCTEVNGPGKRYALWVQGCSRKCTGCFNRETHERGGGKEKTIDEIVKMIPEDAEGITVSGGEPFEQAEELARLLKRVSMRNLHCMVYTGFRYEELAGMKDKDVEESLLYTDILIDGGYEREEAPKHAWAGSGNQRILMLEEGKIIKELEEAEAVPRNGELIIDKEGNITITGFIDSRIMAGKENREEEK